MDAQKLSQAEAHSQISNLEKEYDLLQYKLDGWCIWPIFRPQMFLSLMKLTKASPAQRPVAPTKEFQSIVRAIVRDSVRLSTVAQANFVFKSDNVNVRAVVDTEQLKDIYLDDLVLGLDDSYIKIESEFRKDLKRDKDAVLVAPHFNTNSVIFLSKVLSRLNVAPIIRTVGSEFAHRLSKLPSGQIFTEAMVIRSLGIFYWQKKLYSLFFRKVSPQFLVLINGYSNFDLVAAAREQNIQVIELQHGLLNRHHHGYSWSDYALKYATHMPVPHQIFLYGEYWMDELLHTGYWNADSLRAVGNLQIDKMRQLLTPHKDEICTIVITTQDIYRDEIISLVHKFLQIADNRLAVEIIFKLHPSETDKSIYVNAFGHLDCVNVLGAADIPPTQQLILQADYHVSISSTCHYEALAFGTPTIILQLPSHENVRNLSDAGHAVLCKTASELYQFITNKNDAGITEQVKNYYYRPNALNNMRAELSTQLSTQQLTQQLTQQQREG